MTWQENWISLSLDLASSGSEYSQIGIVNPEQGNLLLLESLSSSVMGFQKIGSSLGR